MNTINWKKKYVREGIAMDPDHFAAFLEEMRAAGLTPEQIDEVIAAGDPVELPIGTDRVIVIV